MKKDFILKAGANKDYGLIDVGSQQKLERYESWTLLRPDPQAFWVNDEIKNHKPIHAIFTKSSDGGNFKSSDKSSDKNSDGDEKGKWQIQNQAKIPEAWPVKFNLSGTTNDEMTLFARLTPFKHTGIFPEQFSNWEWSYNLIKKAVGNSKSNEPAKPIKVINLFGYSGGATVACMKAGAHVTHVDSSKVAIKWAQENSAISETDKTLARWILEDAVSFMKKEIRRGNKYDAIIMDPPSFGRGAQGEVWKIERDFLPLINLAKQLLSDSPLFIILNGYASGYSSYAYAENLKEMLGSKCEATGQIEHGELLIESENKLEDKFLPCGICARWGRTI